ncbi:ATPase [Tsuneonella deserti]|uniref:ATPase n=1 Tax=Tsuneonella deserti TaxID=2035528 RepID=A0ABQ1S384_9SPHN|nr:HAD-IC family P-type ATPase [Tsuneonella deserti]GGD87975.1 ATPase [Tsuneonella deserti]
MSEPGHPGLTAAEAAARLAQDGANEFPDASHRSALAIFAGVLREPMLLLLLAGGAIYLLLGDPGEAIILLVFVLLTISISLVQEVRTQRAVEALRDLAMPRATVIRDGRRVVIESREIVRGDLLEIAEGSRIAADGFLVEANALQVDEALLTGESVPVTKVAAEQPSTIAPPPVPGGDNLPYAFSGTLAVRGTGLMQVAATGSRSRIGAIGKSLATLESETPRLIAQTRGMVRWFAVAGIVLSVTAVLLFGFLRGDWLAAILSGIALAMSLLPEELPVVLALFMTIGALRMSRARVLARRGSAIETLGAATVLCTDKTGTLTQNLMEVEELWLPGGERHRPTPATHLPSDAHVRLATLGMLASQAEPFDPMEKALHDLAGKHPGASLDDHRGAGWSAERLYPLAPGLLAMSQVWSNEAKPDMVVAAKGAPEAIADLCHLEPAARREMERMASDMAARGLRVLALAEGSAPPGTLPDSQHGFAFAYRGLVGLADPIRGAVPAAVAQLQDAGIRVVMITGDYPATARAIADQAGIRAGETMSGDEITALDDIELSRRIGQVGVFARVMPEQKLRIVRALKAAGEVVAMTGDGVNDAPSLKAAHIGIAMGRRGTDVARAASAIVLLDDDFGAIVSAVALGRRIYDNIRKAAVFIFAVHLPIAGLAIAPLLLGWPIILGPVLIALLEMVIDPVCSLGFEAEPADDDVLARPPRAQDSPLVTRGMAIWAAAQGSAALALVLALGAWATASRMAEPLLRATCFAGLVVAVLILVLADRSFGRHVKARNRALPVILGVTMGVNAAVLAIPQVAQVFGLAALGYRSVFAVALLAALLAAAIALLKPRFRASLTV